MDFGKAKELFRDVIDINRYIPLMESQKIEIDIKNGIKERDKIVLLSGEAGSGKSFILNKIYNDLTNDNENVIFVKNPFLEFKQVIELFDSYEYSEVFSTILIDEAQIIPEEHLEQLRLLTDSGKYTVVLATHISNAKELFSKKHFQTRISYNLKISPIEVSEVEEFIVSKLVKESMQEISSMFHNGNYKLIYKLTKGNLREINKLMFKTFDILEYFNDKYPQKINLHKLQNKFIEMADMDLKGADA